ncbi:aspartyl protease family protein [Pedobacter sp. L105]|uniref:aspartyl protease family protein n=1 Tax=Pedobacter sp. L105 TaxID=1641871 RepID=UPI00131B6A8E|nr:aspartyl protease family protein [Pedobacter sp. L105]
MSIRWPIGESIRLNLTLIVSGLWISIICLSSPLYAQKFEFDGRCQKQSIDFIKIRNLIVIPVFINNKGPYNFLLDTGVAQMIITDTTFLSALNCGKCKTIKVQGYSMSDEIEAVLTRNITVKVGKSTIKNMPTAIFKTDIFDLSSYLGMKIHGILGYYFFSSFLVKVNYTACKITIYNPDTKVKRKGTKIPIEIINAKPYFMAEMNIPTQGKSSVELLIDNGSSHPLMMESINNQPFPLPDTTISANLGVGINGQIRGKMGRISTMQIGNFPFENILSGFPIFNSQRSELEGETRNGSLGADVLKHFLVTFDYSHNALYLKKTSNYKNKFNHDMSGIEIYAKQDKQEHFFISRIEPDSPAEQAGLETDDEIISLNFQKTQTYTLTELTEMFSDEDGKQVIIEVKRKDKNYVTLLKLKKRI